MLLFFLTICLVSLTLVTSPATTPVNPQATNPNCNSFHNALTCYNSSYCNWNGSECDAFSTTTPTSTTTPITTTITSVAAITTSTILTIVTYIPVGEASKNPMSETEQLVAEVVLDIGCTAIIIACAISLGSFLFLRIFTFDRFFHMTEEITLMIAHILILTVRDKTENQFICGFISMILNFLFVSHFTLLLLESINTYALLTNVVSIGGFCTLGMNVVVGFMFPLVASAVEAYYFIWGFRSNFSCWVNFGKYSNLATSLPIFVLSIVSIVITEASTLREYAKLPLTDRGRVTAARASQKLFVAIVVLDVASWFVGSQAVYSQNFAAFSIVFAINVTLALVLAGGHMCSNKEVHALLIRLYTKVSRKHKCDSLTV